jgi:hypothetical protein
LHAITLMIAWQLMRELENIPKEVHVHLAPTLCPLAISPFDFSSSCELMERAARSTQKWLDDGGLTRSARPEKSSLLIGISRASAHGPRLAPRPDRLRGLLWAARRHSEQVSLESDRNRAGTSVKVPGSLGRRSGFRTAVLFGTCRGNLEGSRQPFSRRCGQASMGQRQPGNRASRWAHIRILRPKLSDEAKRR